MRRFRFLVVASALAFATVGCETIGDAPIVTDPEYRPLALRSPDRTFRLIPEERAKVLPGYDLEALERLLRMIRPDMRQEILRYFQPGQPGERSRGMLTEFMEPQLQAVLEEVWAPMWNDAPDEALDDASSYYPGRQIAKQRRESRRREDIRRAQEKAGTE
jgi:hypothetical protein